MNNNTIALLHGCENLSVNEYKKFGKGDTIYGCDSDPEVLKTWAIDKKQEAMDELKKHKCEYDIRSEIVFIEEYALMYFEADENGEFVSGSDYDFAEEK